MYRVKTRNWNQKRIVATILNTIAKTTKTSIYPCSDNDNKYVLVTRSAFRAWLTWACFMALVKVSGGWTYILRPGKEITGDYKSIY